MILDYGRSSELMDCIDSSIRWPTFYRATHNSGLSSTDRVKSNSRHDDPTRGRIGGTLKLIIICEMIYNTLVGVATISLLVRVHWSCPKDGVLVCCCSAHIA